jgi:bifunctional non-homologous end joining protein LigD
MHDAHERGMTQITHGGHGRASDTARPERSPKRAGPLSRLAQRMRAKPPVVGVPLPAFVPPQLATRVDSAPDGDGWLHELKLDGYRILAHIEDGHVRLQTRTNQDWTHRAPALVRELERLAVTSALIDGELVVLNESGTSDFQMLQNSLNAGQQARCVYFAFDLLHLDGEDLRSLALTERKARLHALLDKHSQRVRYSDHVVGHGSEFFAQACSHHAEGIVSKRAQSPYVSRRDRSWLKVKCVERQEFVIGGYTKPAGSRTQLGALLLGTHARDGSLTYAGRVGTGFSRASLAELSGKLRGLVQADSPFDNPPRGAQTIGVSWVRPELVAEIEYAEQTDDGLVRHASFRGVRQDKAANDVTPERAKPR